MKLLTTILAILLAGFPSISNSPTDWFDGDISKYTISHKKTDLLPSFLAEIELDHREITASNRRFNSGCTGRGKRVRLNWIAQDQDHHQVISLSYGGRSYYTLYYFIDSSREFLNIQTIRVHSANKTLNFSEMTALIQKGEYDLR